MDQLLHQLFSGIAMGFVYGGIGLAFVMVYRSTHHLNFAQGEMATFSALIALALIDAGLPYWLAFAATLGTSFVIGAILEWLLMRRLASAQTLGSVMVTVGLLMLFNSLSGFLFGYSARPVASPFEGLPDIGFGLVSVHEIGVALVVLAMVAVLFAFFRFTKLGLGMRAAAYNPASARLVGVNVGLMRCLGWGIAGAIGAAVAVMVAPIVFLDPNMMMGILVYGFAAALLGGLENPWGAVAGGLILGVLENILGAYVIPGELKLSAALSIILVVLLFRPAGMFGRTIVKRV